MCILVVADKRRPIEEELDKMAATNPDGAGIAYREGEAVKWEKGLTLDEIKVINEEVPLPYVLHFRIASCGGKVKELTHPFPVEKEMRQDLSGSIKGFVLFHNGHWHPYKDKGLDATIKNKVKVPDGKWSDTRVMAWLAHMHGPAVLEFIDEKVILFGPQKIEIFHPEGWFRVNDLLVSNRIWEHQYIPGSRGNHMGRQTDNWDAEYTPSVCRMVACSRPSIGATWYCSDHQPQCRSLHCTKPRIIGSENCGDHQPLCVETGCMKPRIVGEIRCLNHLMVKPKNSLDPRGDLSKDASFPASSLVVPGRADNTNHTGEAQRRPLEVGNGTNQPPAILMDKVAQGMSQWARSINGQKPARGVTVPVAGGPNLIIM